ncbi:MAG: MBL fold metallo-hydrolase [Oscillatoriales cyanobacterium RM2_1_1]|nr:MBL fold metallo-hydrolase [Oscillatoriales cyanobacterium SM2_3_0]NJO46690.1 MBL fold metallo-hydrolase [Oscillatoriales cyanobacterium RM2_1_1]
MTQPITPGKPPQSVLDQIYAFSPNRTTLGATAYLIVKNQTNILVDAPPWDEMNQQFLRNLLIDQQLDWLFITHRGSLGQAQKIQQATHCKILIQEQEAYLLPEATLTPFHQEFALTPDILALWTPGHSPGSACLYSSVNGGTLFTGRHLLPNLAGHPVPLRTAKTFHWGRQIQSVQRLVDRFTSDTLRYICPGANTGALRGKRVIEQAYSRLAELDLQALQGAKPGF